MKRKEKAYCRSRGIQPRTDYSGLIISQENCRSSMDCYLIGITLDGVMYRFSSSLDHNFLVLGGVQCAVVHWDQCHCQSRPRLASVQCDLGNHPKLPYGGTPHPNFLPTSPQCSPYGGQDTEVPVLHPHLTLRHAKPLKFPNSFYFTFSPLGMAQIQKIDFHTTQPETPKKKKTKP